MWNSTIKDGWLSIPSHIVLIAVGMFVFVGFPGNTPLVQITKQVGWVGKLWPALVFVGAFLALIGIVANFLTAKIAGLSLEGVGVVGAALIALTGEYFNFALLLGALGLVCVERLFNVVRRDGLPHIGRHPRDQ